MSVAGDLTVFVISAGEQTLGDCVEALGRQTRGARVETIADVYPMSAAFQAMPDRCETRYFLQVDADMILQEEAVERLHDAVRRAPPWTYVVAGQLFEEGFGVGGNVKCWKRSLFRAFSFRDVRTVDRDLHRRARRLGLRRRVLEGVVGVHRPRHSDEAEHLKAKGDVEKWRFLGRPPERYALPLLAGLLAGVPETRHRLLGALLGALTVDPRLSRSKDLRHERALRAETLALLGGADWRGHEGGAVASAFRLAYAAPPRGRRAERLQLADEVVARFGAGTGDSRALLELASR